MSRFDLLLNRPSSDAPLGSHPMSAVSSVVEPVVQGKKKQDKKKVEKKIKMHDHGEGLFV